MSLLPPVEHVVDFEFEKCFADGDSVGHLAVEKLGIFGRGVTTKRGNLWKNYERSQKITNLEDPWDW